MGVEVREAEPTDADQIRAVHLASIEGVAGEEYDDVQVSAWAHDRDPEEYPIESADTYFVVAEQDDRLIGFGWMIPVADEYFEATVEGEITAVYVHPSVARQGVGTRIYTELEAAARRKGVESLGLWASLNSVPFYDEHGYQHVTEQHIDFNGDRDGTVVEKRKNLD